MRVFLRVFYAHILKDSPLARLSYDPGLFIRGFLSQISYYLAELSEIEVAKWHREIWVCEALRGRGLMRFWFYWGLVRVGVF